jgi:AraC-like DNA-binding protein
MQRDAALDDAPALRNALLRLQLATTLLRLSQWQLPDADASVQHLAQQANFRRFRKLLDSDFASRHQVQHYAAALAMSEKTLSRVCLAAAGAPAKALINQRNMLEAKRLLAHTTKSVHTIASELGFDEASNFVKFFRKESGTTPAAFRRDLALLTTAMLPKTRVQQ